MWDSPSSQRERRGHATADRFAHSLQTTELCSRVLCLTEDLLVQSTPLIGKRGLVVEALQGSLRVLDALAVLYIEAADLGQIPIVRPIGCDELRHNGEWLLRVDGELCSCAIELACAHAIRIEVTPGHVANGLALGTLATIELVHCAWVGCECCGCLICLPQVHLSAATSIRSRRASSGRQEPSIRIGLTRNELHIGRALGVAVTSSISGPSFVCGTLVAVSRHLAEVYCSVHTTRQS